MAMPAVCQICHGVGVCNAARWVHRIAHEGHNSVSRPRSPHCWCCHCYSYFHQPSRNQIRRQRNSSHSGGRDVDSFLSPCRHRGSDHIPSFSWAWPDARNHHHHSNSQACHLPQAHRRSNRHRRVRHHKSNLLNRSRLHPHTHHPHRTAHPRITPRGPSGASFVPQLVDV